MVMGEAMTKPTNADEFAGAVARAQSRKAAEDALSAQDAAFLETLRQRWFAIGKTEDFALVKKLLIETRTL